MLISGDSHPALAFLCDNFEAKNMILSEVHISLFKRSQKVPAHLCNDIVPNRPAPLPLPCIVSPLKYEASGPLPSEPFRRAL
jgi:hypothetical protein